MDHNTSHHRQLVTIISSSPLYFQQQVSTCNAVRHTQIPHQIDRLLADNAPSVTTVCTVHVSHLSHTNTAFCMLYEEFNYSPVLRLVSPECAETITLFSTARISHNKLHVPPALCVPHEQLISISLSLLLFSPLHYIKFLPTHPRNRVPRKLQ